MLKGLVTIVFCLGATQAVGQDQTALTSRSSASMAKLIQDGYEIKSSTWAGSKMFVFLQKDKSAYACEFVNVTNTRCGAIN